MPHVRCVLRKNVDLAMALAQLEAAGLTRPSTVVEEGKETLIFGELPEPPDDDSSLLFLFEEIAPVDTSVDWEGQWATSGADYHDGLVHIDLGDHGMLRLQPGPGFGDLSHPTTRLTLQLMTPLVADRSVVDIGTGSGILALAAARMGAAHVLGIDIDPDAIAHARENAAINELAEQTQFAELVQVAFVPTPTTLYLMNMIPLEQREALKSLHLEEMPGEWIVSGVLKEKRADYLKQCDARGWELQEEVEEGEWLAFHFLKS